MSSAESYPKVVKNSPPSHHKFVTYLYKIVDCMTDNESFTTPTPSVAAIKAVADGLATANAKAKSGGQIAVSDRNAKREEAERLVDQLVTYVQVTVRAQAGSPAAAAAAIVSAGLSVRKFTKPSKAPLTAKHGRVSSEVVLVAAAIAKAGMYFWEYSLDQKTWTSAGQTMAAHTTIVGLTPGQLVSFRFRAQGRKGIGEYAQAVTLMVI